MAAKNKSPADKTAGKEEVNKQPKATETGSRAMEVSAEITETVTILETVAQQPETTPQQTETEERQTAASPHIKANVQNPEIATPLEQSSELGVLTKELMAALVPTPEEAEDITEAMSLIGWRRTGAALLVYSIYQKACKGDVSAAKLIREMNDEVPADGGAGSGTDGMNAAEAAVYLAGLSDEELLRMTK